MNVNADSFVSASHLDVFRSRTNSMKLGLVRVSSYKQNFVFCVETDCEIETAFFSVFDGAGDSFRVL